MDSRTFLNGRVTLHAGDCREVMPELPDNSVDSCVTDPPYFLTSIVKRFGADGSAPAQSGSDGRFKRLSGGFMQMRWDAPDAPVIDPAFAHWMAGFIDGEGCFSVHKKLVNGCETYDCQFSIGLRADDKPILIEMQRQLGGIGSMADRPARANDDRKGHAQARYCISSKADCQRLRAVLSTFPLRAKKARDFEVWCHALDAWVDHSPGSSWEDVAYYRDALMAVRNVGSVHSPEQLFFYRVARELLRVMKPGAHLVAFGGTRTYHRLACAIEDAGFEIRDAIMWHYGSGFPKSHDVSKQLDRAAGAEREVVGSRHKLQSYGEGVNEVFGGGPDKGGIQLLTAPATEAAREWEGWGTALKPATEILVLARKPLSEKTVAANVLRWGTGAINIDGCRVEAPEGRVVRMAHAETGAKRGYSGGLKGGSRIEPQTLGRWPANVIHSGSEEVLAGFPETESGSGNKNTGNRDNGLTIGNGLGRGNGNGIGGDSGSAARFFFTAKADAYDRVGSKHPTVKPLDLMQYLVRLVTPPRGTVLDPFAGTGTTAEAAWREGFSAILIEREPEYISDIERRMSLCLAGPDERARESIKARLKGKPEDHGPLFEGAVA